ncbi:MAG: hypothetical protein WDO12_09485 [Pseudomonadota bacterium]
MKLLSTRARAELWRLQNAMRMAGKDRERLLRMLSSSRIALSVDAQRDICLEFACADQEYRHAVALLGEFVRRHGDASDRISGSDGERTAETVNPGYAAET